MQFFIVYEGEKFLEQNKSLVKNKNKEVVISKGVRYIFSNLG